jgi:hypothetical protein
VFVHRLGDQIALIDTLANLVLVVRWCVFRISTMGACIDDVNRLLPPEYLATNGGNCGGD